MKKTLSRLSVTDRTGAYRFDAPKGTPTAGQDPYFKGANILSDPSFENFVVNSGNWYYPERPGGSDVFTLPHFRPDCPTFLEYPNYACADRLLVSWCQTSGPYFLDTGVDIDLASGQAWRVSNWLPDTGDYAAVWFDWTAGGGDVPGELSVICPFMTAPFSARVEPGDAVLWQGKVRVGDVTGTPAVQMTLRWYRSNWNQIYTSAGSVTALTTSYTNYSLSAGAPSGAYYLRASFTFSGGAGNIMPLQVDTCSLGVT